MRSTRILISKSYVCNWHVKSENSRVRRFEKLGTWKLNNLKVIEIRERLEIEEDENSREPRPRRVRINAYCPFCFTCSSKMPARLIDHFRLIFSLVLHDVFNNARLFCCASLPWPKSSGFRSLFCGFSMCILESLPFVSALFLFLFTRRAFLLPAYCSRWRLLRSSPNWQTDTFVSQG